MKRLILISLTLCLLLPLLSSCFLFGDSKLMKEV